MPDPGMHGYADQAMGQPERVHHATEVGRIIARYIADTASFDAGNARVKAGLASTQAQAKSGRTTWANYGKYGVLAVGAMVVGAAKSFANFDRNMNIFAANLNEHGPQAAVHMKAAREEAKRLGADSRFPAVTAAHVADAFVELSKAGMNYKKSMQAIEPTLLLGTAGQMDFAEAAAITSNAMNAFGLTGKKDVLRTVDDIAGAALESSSNVQDIAEAFRYTSTAAASLGVPIDQVTTMVGLLSNLGLKGDMAGTSMRMFFTSLAKPRSNPAFDAMNKQGMIRKDGTSIFFNKKGEIKSLEEIARIYKSHTKNLNKQQQLAFAHTVFGVRGMNVARVLSKGGDAFADFQKRSTKAGSANRLAAANTKGLYGAYQRLVNIVQTLGLELGEYLAPYLIKVMNALTRVATWVEHNQRLVKAFAKAIVFAVAGLLIFKGVMIAWRLTMIASNIAMGISKGLMIAYRTAVVAVRAPMLLARIAAMQLNAAFLANPIGIIVLAIIGAILILRHFGVGLNDLTRIVKAAWTKIKAAFFGVLGWIKGFFAKNWKTALLIAVTGPVGLIFVLVRKYWDDIKGLFTKVKDWVVNTFKKNWKGALIFGILGPIKSIVDLIRGAWGKIKEILRKIIDWIIDLGPAAYNAAKGLGGEIKRGIWDGMKGLGSGILDKIPGVKIAKGAAGLGGDVAGGIYGAVTGGDSTVPVPRPGPGSSNDRITEPRGLSMGPTVTIENMSVRSEEDPYVIASVIARQLRLAQ